MHHVTAHGAAIPALGFGVFRMSSKEVEQVVVLRWLVQQEGVVALSKTANPKRVPENFAIFDFTLTGEEMAALHALARPDGRIVSPPGLAPQWDR